MMKRIVLALCLSPLWLQAGDSNDPDLTRAFVETVLSRETDPRYDVKALPVLGFDDEAIKSYENSGCVIEVLLGKQTQGRGLHKIGLNLLTGRHFSGKTIADHLEGLPNRTPVDFQFSELLAVLRTCLESSKPSTK